MLSELFSDFFPAVVLAAVTAGVLSFIITRLRAQRKIKQLGGWAKLIPSKFFGKFWLTVLTG